MSITEPRSFEPQYGTHMLSPSCRTGPPCWPEGGGGDGGGVTYYKRESVPFTITVTDELLVLSVVLSTFYMGEGL